MKTGVLPWWCREKITQSSIDFVWRAKSEASYFFFFFFLFPSQGCKEIFKKKLNLLAWVFIQSPICWCLDTSDVVIRTWTWSKTSVMFHNACVTSSRHCVEGRQIETSAMVRWFWKQDKLVRVMLRERERERLCCAQRRMTFSKMVFCDMTQRFLLVAHAISVFPWGPSEEIPI